MSTYLPAPYESAPDDDLAASIGATLTVTLALLTSWIVGVPAYDHIRAAVDLFEATSTPSELALRTGGVGVGWGIAVLFMVLGSITLVRRRGRGGVIFGALLSIATTFVADTQFKFFLADRTPDSWVFYGGIAVVIAALLPATKRWMRRAAPPAAVPVPTTAMHNVRIGQAQR